MTEYSWFANSAQLQVTIGGTVCPVAALKNVTMTPRYEVAELYGIESTHIKARAKYQLSVDVRCEYAMWDSASDFILSSFLNGGYAASPTSGVATDNDSAGWRSKCALFNITATVYDSTRAKYKTATVYNVHFNEISDELAEDSFITRNLTGKGESYAYSYKDA